MASVVMYMTSRAKAVNVPAETSFKTGIGSAGLRLPPLCEVAPTSHASRFSSARCTLDLRSSTVRVQDHREMVYWQTLPRVSAYVSAVGGLLSRRQQTLLGSRFPYIAFLAILVRRLVS
jgi:hypothetical protein